MRLHRLLLLALFSMPFFVGLDDSSVWDSNEAFYVQTPREMLQRGDWTVPYFNGRPRLNKPPLSYWLVAAAYRFFGPDLYWERLIMALLAVGTLGAVYWLGLSLFDSTVALLATGIWATTLRFVILSRRLLIDVLLIFCLLMALAFLVDWLRSGRRWSFLAGALFIGLGFLAKGPLGLFPGFLLVAHLAVGRRLTRLAEAPWVRAGILIVAVAAPWFVALGLRQGWDAPLGFFLRENLARFAGTELFQKGWPEPSKRGLFFYFGVFLADFFPWSLFFLAAVVRTARNRSAALSAGQRESGRLLWLWMGVWFVAFSLSQNKQEYYIAPIYPAAAIWTAAKLRGAAKFWIPGVLASAAMAAVAGGLVWVSLALFPKTSLFWLPLPFLALFSPAVLTRRWTAAAACLSLFLATALGVFLKPLDDLRPVRHLAETIVRLKKWSGERFEAGYYGLAAPSLTYYLNRPIREALEPDEAARLLEGSEPVFLIVDERALGELRERLGRPIRIVEERPLLSTNSKTLLAAWRSGRANQREAWTRPVFLVSNRTQ